MKFAYIAPALLGLPLAFAGDEPLTNTTLQAMIEGLGYTTKNIATDPAKSSLWEFTVKTTAFNVPMSAEISPSGNYVWVTVNLGAQPKENASLVGLLKANSSIQPSFFYFTTKTENLKLAHPIDNRNISPAILKRVIDKVVKDVDSNASVWQAK